jgi:hypothetical protein
MDWGVLSIAHASSVLGDPDEAEALVRASVRRAAKHAKSPVLRRVYVEAGDKAAASMHAEGWAAVSAGRPWRYEDGDVWVSLHPWDRKHEKAPHRPEKGR